VPARGGPDSAGIATVSEVIKLGDKFRLITEDPPAVIAGVMAFAAASRTTKVISVNTYGPSLEDVFIKLTGLEIRTRGVKTVD
jgi:ABC-2 type transport system ATP-binding protein